MKTIKNIKDDDLLNVTISVNSRTFTFVVDHGAKTYRITVGNSKLSAYEFDSEYKAKKVSILDALNNLLEISKEGKLDIGMRVNNIPTDAPDKIVPVIKGLLDIVAYKRTMPRNKEDRETHPPEPKTMNMKDSEKHAKALEMVKEAENLMKEDAKKKGEDTSNISIADIFAVASSKRPKSMTSVSVIEEEPDTE